MLEVRVTVGDGSAVQTGSEDFLAAFDAFARAVRRARGASVQAGNRELTLSQYALLAPLADGEATRVRDLATEAGITAPTATRILDALERRDIVRRKRSAHDRRAVTVRLTDFGRAVLAGQEAWLRGKQREFFAGLPSEEQELAPDLLLRLAALIDEVASGPTG
jgi:DNA-binding MarR family transcriptional regulator